MGFLGISSRCALILMGAWCEAVKWQVMFRNYKTTMKKRVRKQSQVESSWWYNAKSDFFVTGEVFLLDIGLLMGGLLMGAKVLKIPLPHLT